MKLLFLPVAGGKITSTMGWAVAGWGLWVKSARLFGCSRLMWPFEVIFQCYSVVTRDYSRGLEHFGLVILLYGSGAIRRKKQMVDTVGRGADLDLKRRYKEHWRIYWVGPWIETKVSFLVLIARGRWFVLMTMYKFHDIGLLLRWLLNCVVYQSYRCNCFVCTR